MRKRIAAAVIGAVLAGCSHSDSFDNALVSLGPEHPGSDEVLTAHSTLNYWPSLAADSGVFVYSFGDINVPLVQQRNHRCIGTMRVTGGTRFWQWCDFRTVAEDSITSFPAYALAADGKLLYLEAVSPVRSPFTVPTVVLWLADTTRPQVRRALLPFPQVIGDSSVSWLADLQWIGANTFVALAQRVVVAGHCGGCTSVDSVFFGQHVVTGSVTDAGATITAVQGTAGATSYALAEDGASIVFARRNETTLMKVSVNGGTPSSITITPRTDVQVVGVSCRGTTCVAAIAPIILWDPVADTYPALLPGKGSELRRVSLANGEATTEASIIGSVYSSPILLPSGDVIVQQGLMFGHLQTYAGGPAQIHLLRGLVP